MALIEHLESEGWETFLRNSFSYALDVLKNDRFRPVGSSVDDLKSWLAVGGVARVFEHLNNQMERCRFSYAQKEAVNDCLEQVVQENRGLILELINDGIIPNTEQNWLESEIMSDVNVQDILSRIIAGERPFEDWMYAHGHSDEDIAAIYNVIDQWLMQRGIIPPPF